MKYRRSGRRSWKNPILMVVEDEAGTIMVKRYRLVLPGEEER